MTIPFSFDWEKAYDPDTVGVVLLKKQRAFLLRMVYNVVNEYSTFLTNYDESDYDDIDAFLSDLSYRLMNYDIPPKENMNNRIMLFPYMGTIVTGNAMTFASTGAWLQNPASNGSTYRIDDVTLSAGSWKTVFHVAKNTNSGILRCDIQDPSGSPVYDSDSSDLYSASSIAVTRVEPNSFTLTEDTIVDIEVMAFGKNSSSANYQLLIYGIELVKT